MAFTSPRVNRRAKAFANSSMLHKTHYVWRVTYVRDRMLAWLDPNDPQYITDAGSGKISVWTDQGPLTRNFTQSSDALRPITGVKTFGTNSLNMLDFDGADDYLLSAFSSENFNSQGDFTIVQLIDVDAVTHQNESIFSFTSTGNDVQGRRWICDNLDT